MIGPILKRHHAKILRMNEEFVHWLSPLEEDELTTLLNLAQYKNCLLYTSDAADE